MIYFTTEVASSPSISSIVRALISQLSYKDSPEAVRERNDDGLSALHLAAMDGNLRAAKRLLDLGADPKQKSLDGNTPLTLAIACSHHSFWEFMLPLSNVNSKDEDGDTPLMFSAWRREPSLVTSLLRAGAKVNAVSRHGSTALWNAVYRESPDVVLTLLQANANMNVRCTGTHLFLEDGETCDEGRSVKKIYAPTPRSLLWVAVNKAGDIPQKREPLTIVGLLLENGYDLKHERWIGHLSKKSRLDSTKMEEIPQSALNSKDMRTILVSLYKRPLFLRDICRNRIREIHELHNSQIPYMTWVNYLKLNKNISDFLTLNYVTI